MYFTRNQLWKQLDDWAWKVAREGWEPWEVSYEEEPTRYVPKVLELMGRTVEIMPYIRAMGEYPEEVSITLKRNGKIERQIFRVWDRPDYVAKYVREFFLG